MDENEDLYEDNKSNDDASGSDNGSLAIEEGKEELEVEELEEEEEEVRKKLLLLKKLSTTSNLIVV